MATDTHVEMQQNGQVIREREIFSCSIGIMAYNEEANIARTLQAVREQCGPSFAVCEIIVVASGCTDRTVAIVAELARVEKRLVLLVQEKREGKASAVNLFLKKARAPFLILLGADVIPAEDAFEHLCVPFSDRAIGMVGGRPVPINDPRVFMGHAVHLLWCLHDRVARQLPKLGEIIAFRNVIPAISTTSAVDEISIQAWMTQLGYGLLYQPACIVYNKGPLTARDFLKQRRRIYAGHRKVSHQQHYAASTMRPGPVLRQLFAIRHLALGTPRRTAWTLGAILLEVCARTQGHYDYWRGNEHYIWQTVTSTKNLALNE